MGTAEEFRVWVWDAHAGMQAHSHQIANILSHVDIGRGAAVSEAYVTVCLRTMPGADGRTLDIIDRGRYLDRWARAENGVWRVAERRFRSDIQHVIDASNAAPVTAVRDSTDASYTLFGKLAGADR